MEGAPSDPLPVDLAPQVDVLTGFIVKNILDHKYQNGWKFLIHWEGFPPSQSTWEPCSSFIFDNGSVNENWEKYCLQKGLENVFSKALQKMGVVPRDRTRK